MGPLEPWGNDFNLIQTKNDPIGSSIGITQYPLPKTPLGYDVDYVVPNFGVDPEILNVQKSLAETEKTMGQEFHLPDPDTQKVGYPTGYTVPNFGADHDIVGTQNSIATTEEKLNYKWTPVKDTDGAWVVPQPINAAAYSYRP